MNIIHIHQAAKARGLARSLRHFPVDFLRMASNYAADTGLRRCSTDALLNLRRYLGELRQADLQQQVADRLLAAGTRDGGSREVRR